MNLFDLELDERLPTRTLRLNCLTNFWDVSSGCWRCSLAVDIQARCYSWSSDALPTLVLKSSFYIFHLLADELKIE